MQNQNQEAQINWQAQETAASTGSSKWLAKEDIHGDTPAKVTHCGTITFPGEQQKLLAKLDKFEKPLIVNKTNQNVLKLIAGIDPDAQSFNPQSIAGVDVVVYVDWTVEHPQTRQPVGGIRLRPPPGFNPQEARQRIAQAAQGHPPQTGGVVPQAAAPAAPEGGAWVGPNSSSDDIPF